jgi:hypothetical protein
VYKLILTIAVLAFVFPIIRSEAAGYLPSDYAQNWQTYSKTSRDVNEERPAPKPASHKKTKQYSHHHHKLANRRFHR